MMEREESDESGARKDPPLPPAKQRDNRHYVNRDHVTRYHVSSPRGANVPERTRDWEFFLFSKKNTQRYLMIT